MSELWDITPADVVIFLATFLVMEGVAALEHRVAMHGFAWSWHRAHHLPPTRRFDENDRFPFFFAAAAVVMFAVGTNVAALAWLIPVAAGVTAYGAVYFLVHDVYIHGRLGGHRLPRMAALDRLAEAHALHHRFNRAPYGMLLPVVPAEVRERSTRTGSNVIDAESLRRRAVPR